MNKDQFLQELSERTNLSLEKCREINKILEKNFLIGKKHKERLINEFQNKLELTPLQSEQVYKSVMGIISNSLKEKVKKPFRD